MEIKLSVKQPGKADVDFAFSCTEQETAMLIQDPVYQAFGKVLVDHVRFESEQYRKQQNQQSQSRNQDRIHNQQQKHDDNLRRQYEVMKHNLEVLERRIDSYRKNSL